jgi:outer membrane protein assembly factor BamE (lipoprotein component of BamABCDE complex)
MKNIKNFIITFLLVGVLSSCFSSGNPDIKDPRNFSKIKAGYTTKQEVQNLFGEPQFKSKDNYGVEKWQYNYVQAELKGETFIPIYGIFAGGGRSKADILEIEFNNTGIVTGYKNSQSNFNYQNFGNSR